MDTLQLKKMKRFRKGFHFIGAIFILIGGLLLFNFSLLLLDPEATIIVNGIASSDFNLKLQAVIFLILFVITGIFLLFGPNSFFNKLFVWRQSLVSLFTQDR